MEEVWKPIIGLEGLYEISSLGRVKSLREMAATNKKFYYRGSIILKGSTTNNGYRRVTLTDSNKRVIYQLLHRLLAIHFIPNPNNLPHINHKDGNKLNNSLDNLEWCTNRDNVIHAWENNLVDNRGEKCGTSKLKEFEVRDILQMSKDGYSKKDIHLKYNQVSQGMIGQIINRTKWKHITI